MTQGTPPFSADAALRHFRSYFTEPKDVVAHPQLSRDEKLAILREWEQDALRLSTSESEGMGGGEESMLNATRILDELCRGGTDCLDHVSLEKRPIFSFEVDRFIRAALASSKEKFPHLDAIHSGPRAPAARRLLTLIEGL